MKKACSGGFTLIELMIVVVLAGILAAVAMPSFNGLILSNRMSAQVNDMVGAINLARSEAVKRGNGVTICQSSDGASCGGTTNWESGWIVFDDPNVDAAVASSSDLVRVFPALSGGTTALFNGTNASITFLGVGRPVASFTGAVATVCPPGSAAASYCRYICINPQGRPHVDTPAQYAAEAGKLCGPDASVGG
jgi:type IV fimbrial biogenesis protein FimT